MNNPRHLGGYFYAISHTLAQYMQESCEDFDLTSSQIMFLHHLWYRDTCLKQPTCAKDLEAFFEIRHSTVSGILQRMEAAGFLTFSSGVRDHRRKTIHLTQKALAAHAAAEQCMCRTDAQLIRDMTESEAAQFQNLLERAGQNLGIFCHSCETISDKEESSL